VRRSSVHPEPSGDANADANCESEPVGCCRSDGPARIQETVPDGASQAPYAFWKCGWRGNCGAMGARTEDARDRLWLAESLVKQGRRADADIELQRALAFYRSVGATRYIREGEALLSASA
jgi:hypothetical protein